MEEPRKVEEAPPVGRPLGVEEYVVDNSPPGGGAPRVEEASVVEDAQATRGTPGDEELPEVGVLVLEVGSLTGGGGVERVSIV